MINLLKNKWMMLFFGTVVVLLWIVNAFSQPTPQPTPLHGDQIKVTSINPSALLPLTPNQQQTFNITFSQPVSSSDVEITLTKSSMTKDEGSTTVGINTSLSSDKTQMNIKTKESIPQLTVVTLTVSGNNILLFTATFTVDKLQPTPVQTNNPSLTPYLPYETTSYSLSYDKERNVYVFNFIYNPDFPDNLQAQFEKAKQDAILFIESKGIDINTVVIEWLYS